METIEIEFDISEYALENINEYIHGDQKYKLTNVLKELELYFLKQHQLRNMSEEMIRKCDRIGHYLLTGHLQLYFSE